MQTASSSINELNNPSISTAPTARRPKFTGEQRKAILERYHTSGLKQQDFIAAEGISKATLGKWLRGERRELKARLAQPRFQEVLVQPPACCPWQVEIVSPQNWSVRFTTAPASGGLEQLLRSLPC
ncbi:MAG: IS66 family insertion sequence element accessory protein TnpA [Limisphaerales bacterium]